MPATASLPLFSAVVPAPFGAVGVRAAGGVLQELCYLPASYKEQTAADAFSVNIAAQVTAYLHDPDYQFDLPLPELGTVHQRKVWAVINAIPRGCVLTYGDVARRIGSAPRAVGQACGANWFPLVIPCHRVTASGGIGGFARHDGGFHQDVKRWLLAHEGVTGF